MISNQNLKMICILLMCDDPSRFSDAERNDFEFWLNQESKKLGYNNWIDAYHKIN